jgi:hypothetical protein
VGNQHDAKALVGQAPHQIDDLTGLRHPECCRRFVQQHDLRVPQHALGDRDGLALTTGQAGDGLPHGLDRLHRQRRQRLASHRLHAGLVEHPPLPDFATEEHVRHDVQVLAQG